MTVPILSVTWLQPSSEACSGMSDSSNITDLSLGNTEIETEKKQTTALRAEAMILLDLGGLKWTDSMTGKPTFAQKPSGEGP